MTAEELVSRTPDLKPPAASVVKLLATLSKPDSDTEQAVRIVELDAVLSAKVLSLCNSAWFGSAGNVSSISQAMLRLGFQQIHRIVMAVSFGSIMDSPLTGYAIDDRELWQHSLLTGFVAKEVLTAADHFEADPSTAFTAGLLHDIGKLVLDATLDPETQRAVRALIADGGHSRIEGERLVIGCDHSEVGACLLKRWNLPQNILEAVAHHHAPPLTPAPELSAIVHLADLIAHDVGSAPGWESFAVPLADGVLDALGISPAGMENLVISAFDILHSEPELAPCHDTQV